MPHTHSTAGLRKVSPSHPWHKSVSSPFTLGRFNRPDGQEWRACEIDWTVDGAQLIHYRTRGGGTKWPRTIFAFVLLVRKK
jgi:hypothetical protein